MGEKDGGIAVRMIISYLCSWVFNIWGRMVLTASAIFK